MKKFWILYICTWSYDVFRKEFYDSCEKFLFGCDIEKHYFVWTDSDKIKVSDKIHVFPQKDLWWPNNTLKRFSMFLSRENELKKMDYLFYFNANLEIMKPIWVEILPSSNDQIVVSTVGFYYFCKDNKKFAYDRNPNSTAYIKKWEWSFYVQWWLNGWTTDSYLNMCKKLDNNIKIDENNWVVALWHDESHLNRYVYELEMNWYRENFKVLPPSYLYAEWFDLSYPCKILMRNKSRYVNVFKVKKSKDWFKQQLVYFIKKFLKI